MPLEGFRILGALSAPTRTVPELVSIAVVYTLVKSLNRARDAARASRFPSLPLKSRPKFSRTRCARGSAWRRTAVDNVPVCGRILTNVTYCVECVTSAENGAAIGLRGDGPRQVGPNEMGVAILGRL